jgi:hypothetical protein
MSFPIVHLATWVYAICLVTSALVIVIILLRGLSLKKLLRMFPAWRFKKIFGSKPVRDEERTLKDLHYCVIVKPRLARLARQLDIANEAEAKYLGRIKNKEVLFEEAVRKLPEIREEQRACLAEFRRVLELAKKFGYVEQDLESHTEFLRKQVGAKIRTLPIVED